MGRKCIKNMNSCFHGTKFFRKYTTEFLHFTNGAKKFMALEFWQNGWVAALTTKTQKHKESFIQISFKLRSLTHYTDFAFGPGWVAAFATKAVRHKDALSFLCLLGVFVSWWPVFCHKGSKAQRCTKIWG
jgi:hypothetical protein